MALFGKNKKANQKSKSFSREDPKKVLRTMRTYIGADKIVKSLSFTQVIKRSIKNMTKKK